MNELSLDGLLGALEDSGMDKQASVVVDVEKSSKADELKNVLTKEASDASPTGETNMSNETGSALAKSVLELIEKQAAHGEGMGNAVKNDLEEMERQHTDRIIPTQRQGKTVTEVAKSIQMNGGGEMSDTIAANDSAMEGNSPSNVPAKPSDIEKSASVAELMEEGVSFDEAVELVKEASEALEAEAFELEKAAAVGELLDEGISFDDAVALVKEASEALYSEEYSDLEKAAAVGELMDEDGMSFEEAVYLVKEASEMALGKSEGLDKEAMPMMMPKNRMMMRPGMGMNKMMMSKKSMPKDKMMMSKSAMPDDMMMYEGKMMPKKDMMMHNGKMMPKKMMRMNKEAGILTEKESDGIVKGYLKGNTKGSLKGIAKGGKAGAAVGAGTGAAAGAIKSKGGLKKRLAGAAKGTVGGTLGGAYLGGVVGGNVGGLKGSIEGIRRGHKNNMKRKLSEGSK